MRRKRILIPTFLIAVLAIAAFTLTPLSKLISDPANGTPVRGVTTVTVDSDEFDAPAIEVKAGTTVTWRFNHRDEGEPVAHNIKGKGWGSPDIQDGVYKHTFTKAGNYKYNCDLHFLMNGRVKVVN